MANFPPPHHHGFLFHSQDDHDHHLPSPSSLTSLPSCPPQLFPGGGAHFLMKRSMSFSGMEKCDREVAHGEDDLSDDGSQLGEKKKRLNLEQVKALEKSFEIGNKLEPERKMQLAKALGLQPRQVAIWFQNRRARWKTKQLEKDYDVLKKQFDAIMADNDALLARNKKLQSELMGLKGRDGNEINLKKETDQGSWSNGSENSYDHANNNNNNIERSRTPVTTTSPQSSHQLTTKHLFSTSVRPPSMTHLLQTSSRSSSDHHHHHHPLVQEENLCNMFNGIEEQQGFWPWPEQQQHHPQFSLGQIHQFSNN